MPRYMRVLLIGSVVVALPFFYLAAVPLMAGRWSEGLRELLLPTLVLAPVLATSASYWLRPDKSRP